MKLPKRNESARVVVSASRRWKLQPKRRYYSCTSPSCEHSFWLTPSSSSSSSPSSTVRVAGDRPAPSNISRNCTNEEAGRSTSEQREVGLKYVTTSTTTWLPKPMARSRGPTLTMRSRNLNHSSLLALGFNPPKPATRMSSGRLPYLMMDHLDDDKELSDLAPPPQAGSCQTPITRFPREVGGGALLLKTPPPPPPMPAAFCEDDVFRALTFKSEGIYLPEL